MARLGYSWNPFNPYCRRAMRARGRADGAAGVPLPGSDQLPPAEADLRAAGNHDLALVAHDFAGADDRLHAAYRHAAEELRQARAHLDRTLAEHDAARARYEDHHGELAPRTTSRSHRAYWLALAVLAAVELPVNKAAFALLRDNVLLTWAAAAGVGLILLGSAHVLGGLARNVRRWTWTHIAVAFALLAGAAGTTYATAVLRRSYLLLHGGADGLDPDTAFWVFAAFSAGLFFLGAALSFRVHRKWSGEVARTGRIVARARARRDAAEKAVQRARTRREQAFEVARAEGLILQEAINWRAEVYREANLRARTDLDERPDGYPASYTTPLALDWPDALQELAWDAPPSGDDAAGSDAPADETAADAEPADGVELAEYAGDGLAGTPAPDIEAPKS